MKVKITMLALSLVALQAAWAQQEGEPIKSAEEVPLGGFEGCSVAPPKDGCSARIKCYGVGRILGNTPFAVQDATKEAQLKARANLAKFYSEKVKAKEALATASEAAGQSNANGGMDVKESFSRMQAEVIQTSAESVISGFQVIGRMVDTSQRTVTIKGAVSCKSQAAAAQSQAASARSVNPQTGSGAPVAASAGPGAYTIGPGGQRNMNQRTKNADDF